MSDFYEKPEEIVKVIEPLRYHGNEVVLFHLLDPNETRAEISRSRCCCWMSKTIRPWKSRPNTRARNTERRSTSTCSSWPKRPRAAGLEYVFMNTSKPLDQGLRNYLAIRQRRR